jgi:hypothetical protein
MGTPGRVVLPPTAAGLPRRRRGWDDTSIPPRCGVSSQVGGLIVWPLASEAEGRRAGGSVQPVGLPVVGEPAEQVVRGWPLPERAAVALGDGGLDLGRVAGEVRVRT